MIKMQNSITSARAFIENSIFKQGLAIEDVMLECPVMLSFSFLWQQIKNKANLKEFSHPLLSEAYQCNEVIFLESRMSSPMIAIQLETLAALGIKKVIYIGIAGSISPDLRIGDIVVSKGAINETGTGICYGHDLKSVIWGDPELSNQVHVLLKKEQLNSRQSIHWSTDAPYRESLEKVLEFREMGAICVEMEGGRFFCSKPPISNAGNCGFCHIRRIAWFRMAPGME